MFWMHVCLTLATRHVLESIQEAFEWVLGEIEAKFNQSLVNSRWNVQNAHCPVNWQTCQIAQKS